MTAGEVTWIVIRLHEDGPHRRKEAASEGVV